MIKKADGSDPPFAYNVPGDDGFFISTDNMNDVGDQELILVITPDPEQNPNNLPPINVNYNIKITGCLFDTVMVDQKIGTIPYQISASSEALEVTGDFTNEMPFDCGTVFEYSLIQVDY